MFVNIFLCLFALSEYLNIDLFVEELKKSLRIFFSN